MSLRFGCESMNPIRENDSSFHLIQGYWEAVSFAT